MVQKAARSKVKAKKKVAGQTGASSKKLKSKKIAIVVSLFNESICLNLEKGALDLLKEKRIPQNEVDVFHVAGAFEIPLVAQRVLRTKKYRGVIALGCVIRGGTPHFEYVCHGVTDGLLRVQLDESLPIAFGVLTTDDEKQAVERSGLNDFNKGREAALALLDSFKTLEVI